jgi:hypothetical protein
MTNRLVAPVLLCGRYFNLQELLEIQEMVRMFPKLSRDELTKTLCENLDWVTPAGQYKRASCLQLLEKMERQGLITLPAKREPWGANKTKAKEIVFSTRTAPASPVEGFLGDHEPLAVEPVQAKSSDFMLWNEYIHRYHTLGYKTPFGAHQRYFIVSGSGEKLGCLLFAAAAWALAPRDEWIGWSEVDRSLKLNLVVNNTRFLVFPWVKLKNLASRALSLAVKRIRHDWQARYCYSPVLLETFVDASKYRGTCYRAANWIFLGQTAGRGRMDRYKKRLLTRKDIYVYPLVSDFRDHLQGEANHE